MPKLVPLAQKNIGNFQYRLMHVYEPDRYVFVKYDSVEGTFWYYMCQQEADMQAKWADVGNLAFMPDINAPINLPSLFGLTVGAGAANAAFSGQLKQGGNDVSTANPLPVSTGNNVVKTEVTNFPATQPISGNVGVIGQPIAVNAKIAGADVSAANPLPTANTSNVKQGGADVSVANPLQVTGTLNTVPATVTSGILSVTTPVILNNWVTFGSQACKTLTVFNNWAVAIEVRKDASTSVNVPAGQQFTFRGLTNANQMSLRRQDLSLTPLVMGAYWENY